jgi:outer membrane protein TolC
MVLKKISVLIVFFLPLMIFSETVKVNLSQAQMLAVLNDTDLRIAKATQKLSTRSYYMGYSKFFPQFSTNLQMTNFSLYEINNNRLNYYTDPYETKLGVQVDQLLFDGGELIFQTYFRGYEVNIMGKENDEKEQAIKEKIEGIFCDLTYEEEKVAELEKKLKYLQEEKPIIEKKLNLLTITELEYKEFLINMNESEINLIQEKRKNKLMLNDFKDLINVGREVDVKLESDIDIKETRIPESALTIFQEYSIRNRSKSMSLMLKNYNAKIKQVLTYIALAPKINSSFVYNFLGNGYPLYKNDWTLTISLNWNLPFFPTEISSATKFPTDNTNMLGKTDRNTEMLGDVKTNIKTKYFDNMESINSFEQSQLNAYKAQVDYDKYVSDNEKKLTETIGEYNELLDLLRLSRNKIELLKDKLKILKVKLDQGTARYIDVLEAENSLFSAEMNFINNKNQIYKKIITLKSLTGITKDEFYQIIN